MKKLKRSIKIFSFIMVILAIFATMDYANETKPNGELINVESFGAKPNDINDDADAIQSAINNAHGKTVYLPKGKYYTSKRIVLPDNTKIAGETGAIIIANNIITSDFVTEFDRKKYKVNSVLFADGANNIEIRNIQIDANKGLQKSRNVSAIYVRNTRNCTFTQILVKNNKATDFSKGSGAFTLEHCTKINIVECYADMIDTEGLLLRYCSNITVKGGEWKNSSSSCIGTQYGDHIEINNVLAHDSDNSTISLNSTDSIVSNSTIYNSRTFFAINMGHRTSYQDRKSASNSVIVNCNIYNGYVGGINIAYGNNIKVLNNNIYNCRGAYDDNNKEQLYAGISAYYWANKITLKGNKITNCIRGIQLKFGRKDSINNEYTVGNSVLSNNIVTNNILSGVEIINAYDVQVVGNKICSNNKEKNISRGNLLLGIKDENNGSIKIIKNEIGSCSENMSDYIGILILVDKGIVRGKDSILLEKNRLSRNDKPIRLSGKKIDNLDIRE